MSVYIIFACEVITVSFLIGTYMGSVLFGLSMCGLSSLIMYALYQKFYRPAPFIWGISLLSGVNSILWASYLDTWLGTTFIALTAGTLTAFYFYFLNKWLFTKFPV